MGIKVVKNRKISLDEVARFIDAEILSKYDENPASAHLKTLEPGVVIEELFPSAGLKPLEAKLQVIEQAELLARALKVDMIRVDFFINRSPWRLELNEAELVSGHWHVYDRTALREAWSTAYLSQKPL